MAQAARPRTSFGGEAPLLGDESGGGEAASGLQHWTDASLIEFESPAESPLSVRPGAGHQQGSVK